MSPPTSRRELLKLAAGLGTAPAWAAGRSGAAGDADWPALRGHFELAGPAPLNAANLCPAWREVLLTQHEYGRRLSADVGFLNRRDFVRQELADARRACANTLGLRDAEDLAFVRNTSEANAVIVSGLDLKAQDEVLLWRENHATNYRSWHYRHRRHPFVVRNLALPAGPPSPDALVEAFVTALTPRTRVVSFSHLSNVSGTLLPAAAICRAIHAYDPDIFVHIDGAQSWGSLALDLEAMDCDSYAASGHKWLCGPRGTGILFVRRRWASRLQPLLLGYDFSFDYPAEELQGNALRFENLGQRDTAAYGALGVAARRYREIGPGRIEARIRELTQHAIQAFEQAGIRTLTPADPRFGHGVIVADLGHRLKSYGAFLALHNAGYAAAFIHGNRVHCSPQGPQLDDRQPVHLRICPHIYNSPEDIDAAVAIAARIRDSGLQIIRELIRYF